MDKIEFRRRISRGEDIGKLLENADESILSDRECMIYAILRWRGAFQYATDELKNDKAFVMEYLNANCGDFPLQYASQEVRTDTELLLQIAKIDPRTLVGADRSVLDNKDFIRKVVEFSPIPFAYSKLSRDKEFVEEVVEINGLTLENANDFWEDRQLVMRAVKNNGDAINHIPISSSYLQEYLEDEELLVEAAKSMISKEGFYDFYFNLSQEMEQKLDENKELKQLGDEYWNKRRQELKAKESELSSLENEEKTISEAEALIEQQKEGQDIGEN